MAETIICIKSLNTGGRKFVKSRLYLVFKSVEGEATVFTTQDASARKVKLFSSANPGYYLKLLKNYFDLSKAPQLKIAAGL